MGSQQSSGGISSVNDGEEEEKEKLRESRSKEFIEALPHCRNSTKKAYAAVRKERFAKQLGKKYPVFSEKTAQKLANIVLKACYSDQGLTKKECQFVLDCYETLAEAVSKELSPAKRLAGSLIFCFW